MGENRKSVVYIGGFELPDKNAAAQRVVANGKILNALGYHVYYIGIAHYNQQPQKYLRPLKETPEVSGWVQCYPKTLSEWFNYLTDISAFQQVIEQHLAEPPGVVIAYNYSAIALARLRKYCKKREIGLVADCTEWYGANQGVVFRILKSMDTMLRMRWLHPKLDGIIAISRYLYDYYAPRTNHVVLIPPLVDALDSKWKSFEPVVSIDHAEKRRLIYAGSPGNKGEKDRVDKVIKAVAVVANRTELKIELTIIGLTQEQYFNTFGSDATVDAFRPNLRFAGRLSHCETIDAIKHADYFFFLRDRSRVTQAGFPTKFVEAITAGTPVLTNYSSNIQDYLIEGVNGFFIDTSTDKTLTDSLTKAINQSPEQIVVMKEYCRNSRVFDYQRYINDFNVVLRGCQS